MEDREVSRRNAEFRPPALPARGDARLYAEHVLQARRGCDFAFLSGKESAGEAME
jgi:dihydroxy-acid dehydratase